MTTQSQSATALMALMRLRGVGRRAALRLVAAPDNDVGEDKYREAIFVRAGMARLPENELQVAWSRAEEQLEAGAAKGVQAFSIHDPQYPKRLRHIPDPPAVLFVKGSVDGLNARQLVAIVGTREPTEYGAKVARRAGESAARAGCTVVSGLAHGCDTFGHEGCLDVEGLGVAVLAHGLDRVYPAANRDLAKRLLDAGGCLVSEYPLGMTPMRTAFAERDRIQSGLSDGVLVIETDIKGGTMHTVRFAREQGRYLACIDHPPKWRHESKTQGNQMLITEGSARPIPDGSSLQDFFCEMTPDQSQPLTEPKIELQEAWTF